MHALDVDNEIAVQFAYFVAEVKAFSAMNRTDINRVAQNILVPIFNEIYGYSQLRNLDVGTGGNFPGIDLADDNARVAVQVTSTSSLEKIKHTLEQFLQDRTGFAPPLAKKYDRLIVYILTEKQKTYSQPSIDSVLAGRFPFVASRDIWDSTNLLADMQGLPLAKKEALLGILKSQLAPAGQAEGLGEHAAREALLRREAADCASLRLLRGEAPVDLLYQEQPLLFEIRRERLPRAAQEAEGSKQGAEPDRRSLLIEQWEEEVREERVVTKPCTIEELFTDFRRVVETPVGEVPRFVLLGQPGGGKSTLAQVLAYRAARGELRVRRDSVRLLPARVALRAWERAANETNLASLPAYLESRTRDGRPAATEVLWRRWLQRGDVLLLLDGLDEIADQRRFEEVLKRALTDFAACPTVLTCRSINFEQHRAACPDLPIFLLSGLDIAHRAAYIRAYRDAFHARFDAKALIDGLNRHPAMRPLAANPLLLSIICFVVGDPDGLELPATRGNLYDRAVDKLLGYYESHKRLEPQYPLAPPGVSDKRMILEHVALELFARSRDALTFDEYTLGKSLRRALAAVDYGGAAAPWANALQKDLIHNSGLLRGDADRDFFFLHPTVQEFLAASALARLVDDEDGNGWDSAIRLGGQDRTVRELVDRKAWDPRWREVVCMLTGRLEEPGSLLKMLSDPKPTATNSQGDDAFHHRLALAATSMAEIPEPRRKHLAETINNLTSRVFAQWWEARRGHTEAAHAALRRALPSVALVNGDVPAHRLPDEWFRLEPAGAGLRSLCVPLLDRIAELLSETESSVKAAAAMALGGLGSAAATEPILAQIAVLLRSSDASVGLAAKEAAWGLGAAAATQPFLAQIAVLLRNPDASVQYRAGDVVRGLGAAAATELFLTQIVELLRDPERRMQTPAARAASGLGAAAATEPFLAEIALLLRDPEWGVRQAAAEAVGGLGPAAATEPILAQLAVSLRDPDWRVRSSAAKAVVGLGPAAATEPIRARIAELLRDPDGFVRSAAAEALGGHGAAMATEVILAQIAELLRDPDLRVRSAAVTVMRGLGAAAATEPFLARIAELLRDPESGVRWEAVWAVRGLGAAAATEPFLARLAGLLRDPESDVRDAAAKAVGGLGAAAATEPFLARIAEMMRDPDEVVRDLATEVVGGLGPAAATEPILAEVAVLLHDRAADARYAAATAVRGLGAVAATEPLLAQMVELLRDADEGVRCSAVQAVGGMGAVAAIEPILAQFAELLRDPELGLRLLVAEEVLKAVIELGAAAATEPILAQIGVLLRDRNDRVREAAAQAVGGMGAAAATEPILAQIAELLLDDYGDVRIEAAKAIAEIDAGGLRLFANPWCGQHGGTSR